MSQKKLTCFLATVKESSSTDCTSVSVSDNQSVDVHVESHQSLLSNETDHLGPQGHEVASEGEESAQCECPCCRDVTVAHQPLHISKSMTTSSYSSQRQGKQVSYSRKIQPGWYTEYPWISVCTTKYRIFCSICRHAQKQNLLTFSRSSKKST